MYRLSDRERAFLGAVELEAKLPLTEIAKRASLKHHTATYFHSKLQERGLLGPRRASINKYKLGYTDFHVLFSLAADTTSGREEFVRYLVSSSQTAWLAEVGGSYQYALSIRVFSVAEAYSYLQKVRDRFPDRIQDQELAIIVKTHSYGRKYLYPERLSHKPFRHSVDNQKPLVLDETDTMILSSLSNLSHTSERELSQAIGIPSTTLRRRIKELEAKEIITGYYHHIDTFQLGCQVYKIILSSPSLPTEQLKQLEAYAAVHPNVVLYLEAIGSWQVEMVVEVQEAVKATEIARDLTDCFGVCIRSTEVVPLFQYFKATPFPKQELS